MTAYGKPLYHFFRIREMDGLDSEGVFELLKREAIARDRDKLIPFLEANRPRIELYRILTGGSPRLILFLLDLLEEEPELSTDDIISRVTSLMPWRY